MSSQTSPPVAEEEAPLSYDQANQSSGALKVGDQVGAPSSSPSLVESSKATTMTADEEAHLSDDNDVAAVEASSLSAASLKEASPPLSETTATADRSPPPSHPPQRAVFSKGQPPPPIHIPAPPIQMPSASSMQYPPYGPPHPHHHHMFHHHHHPYHHPPPPPGVHHSHSNMFNPYGPPSQMNRSRGGSGEGGTFSQAPPPPALHYPPPHLRGGSSGSGNNSGGPPPTTAYPPPYGYYPPPIMQHLESSHRSHFFPKDGPSPSPTDNDGTEETNDDDNDDEQDDTIAENKKEKVSSNNATEDTNNDITITTPGPTKGWQNKRRRKELMMEDDNNIFAANTIETPATVDETMSTISSTGNRMMSTGAKVKSLLLAPTTIDRKHHPQQKQQRGGVLPYTPHMMNSPHHSLGSFSAITNLSQLPTPLTLGKTPFMAGELQPPVGGSKSSSSGYVYQYQHFDPRSHVDNVVRKAVPSSNRACHPQRPANFSEIKYPGGGNNASEGGSSSTGSVPPTVHMPNNSSANSTSPLIMNQYSGGGAVGGVSSSSLLSSPSGGGVQSTMAIAELQSGNTPEQQSGGGGGGIVSKVERPKSSPLDLLSSVSTSPVVALPRHGGGYVMQHHPHHPSYHGAPHYHGGGGHSSYMYPPSHAAAAAAYHHHHHYDQYQQQRGGEYDDLTARDEMSSMMNMMDLPPTPCGMPKQSNLELMLSAANTLDIDEVKRAKKRKLSMTDGNTLKKNLLLSKNRPPPIVTGRGPPPELAHSSMYAQVGPPGGYYQGYDMTGHAPQPSSRRSSKTTSKQLAKQQQLAKSSIDPESVEMSRQACQLAKQALERPRVGKKLLLSMALVRTNPRTPPSCYPAHGTVLTERFHWASYPPLDTILRKNMKRYYELSVEQCQSKDQQEFNNELVISIKRESNKYGWEFDRNAFDDKKIRDRIRCFYKTHIQNAKKRLKTMLRHPEKRANIKALAAHFHIIEEKGAELLDQDTIGGGTNSDDSFDSDVDELDDEEEVVGDEGDYDNNKSYSTESGDSGAHHE